MGTIGSPDTLATTNRRYVTFHLTEDLKPSANYAQRQVGELKKLMKIVKIIIHLPILL
jgi:hypothetical protein